MRNLVRRSFGRLLAAGGLGELSEQLAQTKSGVSAIQGQMGETWSHVIALHKEFAEQAFTTGERERLRAELAQARKEAQDAAGKIAEAFREYRLAQERYAQELERARAETWLARQGASEFQDPLAAALAQASQARQEAREFQAQLTTARTETAQARRDARLFQEQLATTHDEIRRLKIRVDELPEFDYQLLMRAQQESAAFLDADPGFMAIYERVRHCSMTSIERLYAMYKATQYVARAGIPGSIVESGVWRGGSMMVAALTLQALGDTGRPLVLFDTFAGLPKPSESEDVDLWGHSQYNEWTRHRRTDQSSDWAEATLAEVKANLNATGYPAGNLRFVEGMVQQTLPNTDIGDIALLRLDTDWYASTICELEYLYPKVSEGGVLIVDDYGHLRGQRKAVDEYLEKENQLLLLNRIDYSGRLAVKCRRGGPSSEANAR